MFDDAGAARPQVTVITPVGPRWDAGYLRAAGQSLAGTAATIEWLIVCDGAEPSDVAAAVAGTGVAARIMGGPVNRGTAQARNAALRCARGAWTYALDADDVSLGAVDKLLGAAASTGASWAAGRSYDTDASGETVTYVPDDDLSPFDTVVPLNAFLDVTDMTGVYPFLCSGATIIRTDVVRAAGGWDEELVNVSEDVALLAKVSARHPGGWAGDEFVLAYRKHAASTTAGFRDAAAQARADAKVRQHASGS